MMKSHYYYLWKKQQKHGDPSAAAVFGGVVVVSAADASPRFLGGGMDSLFIQKSADGDYYDDDMVGEELLLTIKL
eukprot:scaffold10740_cov67-Skeletonema_dohrnii-CCMP3373.AAC.1